MKQTEKYQLNLIETSDRFLADPINENTQALENALIAHGADETAHSDIRGGVGDHIANKSNPHGVTAAQVGAAASSHNHSAANITSGTLPTSRGGTGNTTVDTTPTSGSTKMVTSGGVYTALSGKAASSHNHSADNITSGTLAVARGGTGNASVDTTPTSGSTKMVTSGGIYTALASKFGPGNTGWVTGTYTGSGAVDTAKTITLGFQPSAVLIVSTTASCWGFMIRSGSSYGSTATTKMSSNQYGYPHTAGTIVPTSTGFTVAKSGSSHDKSMNESSYTYMYIAFK